MKKIVKYMVSGLLVLGVASCSEDEVLSDWITDNPLPDTEVTGDLGATINFDNYVAIGNSITAGFMDGSLYNDGQSASYANMVGTSAQSVGGAAFAQPDINSVYGFNSAFSDLANGNIAGRSYLDLSIPGPNAGFNGDVIGSFGGDKSALNNFSVPGMRIGQVEMDGYGFPDVGNPYFTRFASDPSTANVLADALATNPTFFSLWMGANDYLGYALTGGQGNDPLVDLDPGAFGAALTSILTQLSAGGTEGVVIDLPPVVTLPFFQAVPYNAIPLDQASADELNSAYAAYNGGLGAALGGLLIDQAEHDRRVISFSASSGSAFVIEDDELTDLSGLGVPNYRLSEATDLVLLSAVPAFSAGVGTSTPAGDQYILTVAEQTAIVAARATYNVTIAAVMAGFTDLELVSVQDTFVDLLGLDVATATALALPTGSADGVKGIEIDGFSFSPDFAPSGLISTDAIHPNPRGHAVIANLVIDAINARWGASIPNVDVVSQRGVYFSED